MHSVEQRADKLEQRVAFPGRLHRLGGMYRYPYRRLSARASVWHVFHSGQLGRRVARQEPGIAIALVQNSFNAGKQSRRCRKGSDVNQTPRFYRTFTGTDPLNHKPHRRRSQAIPARPLGLTSIMPPTYQNREDAEGSVVRRSLRRVIWIMTARQSGKHSCSHHVRQNRRRLSAT